MELHQLESFVKVAELRNVTRAADALCLTQPAVTQHIKSLEQELETTLLDRVGRGVRLTEAGHLLWEYARRGFSVFDECRQALLDLQECRRGRLVVGAGVTTSIFFLPERLRSFQSELPKLEIVVRTARSREIAEMVLDHAVDLGVVTSTTQHPAIEAEELFTESILLVSSSESVQDSQVLNASDFSRTPLILFPADTGFRRYLDIALSSMGLSPMVKMEIDSVEAIKSFVSAGLGASFLPESAVMAELQSGALTRVHIEGTSSMERSTSVIRRRDRYLSAAAAGFMATLRR